MGELVSYRKIFPKLMFQYPWNYGTIYVGIGLTTDPLSKMEIDECYDHRKRAILKDIQDELCRICNLGLLKIIKNGRSVNYNATTIQVITGKLIEYVDWKNTL
jgi:hypothetical protein